MRGFDIIPVVVGLFGIGEVLHSTGRGVTQIFEGKLGRMMPKGAELKKGLLANLRGTALGLPLGLLPGMLPSLTTFMAYDLEKRISRYPEKFGTGVIEGVAGPEAANNATIQAGFLPLMALGIPTGPAMAILLSVLMMHGLQPGLLFEQNKEFIWTVIGSMYIGNIMLLLLNLPLVGLWARISVIPYKFLSPMILAICVIGAYSPRNTLFDVWVALAFGFIGLLMKKYQWPLAPLIMGFILGPMFEQALRQSWPMGGIKIFIARPIPAFFLILTVIMTVVSLKFLRRGPIQLFEEDDL
jgi:putative tricarboxylic transport membrane protein